jgi:hypothetical protein
MTKNEFKLSEKDIQIANKIARVAHKELDVVYDGCETDEEWELAGAKRDALLQQVLNSLSDWS